MGPRTLLIVTGMSGAGKSTAIRSLEDSGAYCVDNLPLGLFSKFLDLIEGSGGELGSHVALCLDLRDAALDERFPEIYELLGKSKCKVNILFIDASDDALIRRFSETRRPHPLTPKGTVSEGINLERRRLSFIRERADRILDTTSLTIHDLRNKVLEEIQLLRTPRGLTLNIVSFGYTYGLPLEATLVFDVRFLPNPHFVPKLRPLTGEDPEVYRYVMESSEGIEYSGRLLDFVRYLLPCFQKEGKSYLTIAVGCTGGRHRSVAVSRWLCDTLRSEADLTVNLFHRDRTR